MSLDYNPASDVDIDGDKHAGNFGFSLAGADIKSKAVTPNTTGAGEELLIGAPALDSSSAGAVYWFEHEQWSVGPPSAPPANKRSRFLQRGKVQSPGAASGDLFGYAIAVAKPRIDFHHPWYTQDPASAYTGPHGPFVEWIAISAPGADRIDFFEPSPNSAPYLIPSGSIPIPTSTTPTDFGAALAVGDFDGDGDFDLAVGTPEIGTASDGRVDIYLGSGAGSHGPVSHQPDLTLRRTDYPSTAAGDPVDERLKGHCGGSSDEFGFSLATGHFIGEPAMNLASNMPDALVIGVPGDYFEAGGICQAAFVDQAGALTATDLRCRSHESHSGYKIGDRFGHAVAVGSVYNMDSEGATSTTLRLQPEAFHPEVLASSPRFDGLATDEGRVYEIATSVDGIEAKDSLKGNLLTLVNQGAGSLTGPAAGDRMGEALAVGWLEHANGWTAQTQWGNPIVGFPGATLSVGGISAADIGSVAVHYAQGANECPDITGVWTIFDDDGHPRTVRVFHSQAGMHFLNFIDPFSILVEDGSGAECTVDVEDINDEDGDGNTAELIAKNMGDLPAGVVLGLGGSRTCSATSTPFVASGDQLAEQMSVRLGGDMHPKNTGSLTVTIDFTPNGTPRMDDATAISFDLSSMNHGNFGVDATCQASTTFTSIKWLGPSAEVEP